MKINWTSFTGRPFTSRAGREARVTLGPKGIIYLNGLAYEALGSPPAVEMQIDPDGLVIGLKPADPRRVNAFPVKTTTRGTYRYIAASAFMQHYRIRPRATLNFQNIDIDDDGIMALDLRTALNVSRGAR